MDGFSIIEVILCGIQDIAKNMLCPEVFKDKLSLADGLTRFLGYICVRVYICKITACQRTFSKQKHCLSGHSDICMDKMSGQSFSKQIKNY